MKSRAKSLTGISQSSLLAGLLVMASIGLLWLWPLPVPSSTVTAEGTASIYFEPSSQTVDPGVTFEMQVRINPNGEAIAAADVYINFDPMYLSVVEIVNGTGLDIFVKPYNNETGTIDIGAGTLGDPLTTAFTLVTLRLQGKAGTGGNPTQLVFSFGSGRVTVVKDEFDQNKLGDHTNASVYVTGATPTGPPPTATRTPTLTRTATATQTEIPTRTATPTVTRTPVGPPTEIEFQDGRSPNMLYSGTEDTWLDWLENTTPHGAIGELKMRHDALRRPLIKFDVSEYIPYGSTIVEAQLHLWLDHADTAAYIDADLYRVNRHWEESTATWVNPWHLPGCDGVPTDREGTLFATQRIRYTKQWITWDVTDLLRHWVSAPGNNEGVILIGRGEMGRNLVFRSSDFTDLMHHPKLVVRFYAAPPTPTPTRTTTPTNTPTVPPPTPIPGDIEGRVWHDLNANGALDSGEPGLAGSSIRLYDNDHPPPEPPVRPAFVTGADGSFQFTDVPPGWYIVTAALPAGYGPTTSNVVTVMVSSGGTTQANFGASAGALSSIFLPIILRRG